MHGNAGVRYVGTVNAGGQQKKKVLSFGHRRDLVRFYGTALHNKSF